MRCETTVFVLVCLTACHSTGAPPSAEPRSSSGATTTRSVDAAVVQRLHDDVAWLADDERAGRRAGTEEGLVAGRWIADRMRAMGLDPAGTDGTFEQEFRVPLEPRAGENSGFARGMEPDLRREFGSVTTGSMWVKIRGVDGPSGHAKVQPLFASEAGVASGSLAYCGYGIELPENSWDDFANRDLKGKIALVVRGSPTRASGAAADSSQVAASPHGAARQDPHGANSGANSASSGATPANPHGDVQLVAAGDPFVNAGLVFTKVMNAKRRGAVAVVLLQHPSDKNEPELQFHEGGTGRAGIPCVSLSWDAAEVMFEDVLAAWTRDLETKPAPADASASGTWCVYADVERGHGTATNVLGVVPGVDRSRVVVLGAHYDHLGYGGTGSLAPNERSIHNGADDNASGTAAVLEVARALRAGPRPACDVLIALWSGEELGLLGSEAWAKDPTLPFERVVGNVNLDMVGRAGNGKLQILGAGSAVDFAAWLTEAGPDAQLELTVNASASAMAGSSDHATFAKRKVPVLHLFSGLHTDYHKPTDDTERFEADGAALVVNLTLDLVRRMCAASELAFVEPPPTPSGERRIQSGFNAWFGSIPNYAFEGPGVKIDGTSSGSPAERAGFLAGDVLLTIGEVEIANVYDFTYALQHYKPGDAVLVTFERDGQREETRVTLSSRGLR